MNVFLKCLKWCEMLLHNTHVAHKKPANPRKQGNTVSVEEAAKAGKF